MEMKMTKKLSNIQNRRKQTSFDGKSSMQIYKVHDSLQLRRSSAENNFEN